MPGKHKQAKHGAHRKRRRFAVALPALLCAIAIIIAIPFIPNSPFEGVVDDLVVVDTPVPEDAEELVEADPEAPSELGLDDLEYVNAGEPEGEGIELIEVGEGDVPAPEEPEIVEPESNEEPQVVEEPQPALQPEAPVWDARTVEVEPITALYEPGVVLVQISEGADANTLNEALNASGCVRDVAVTQDDVNSGFALLNVNTDNGYDVEHAMLQLQLVEGVEYPQPNYLYQAVDDADEVNLEAADAEESAGQEGSGSADASGDDGSSAAGDGESGADSGDAGEGGAGNDDASSSDNEPASSSESGDTSGTSEDEAPPEDGDGEPSASKQEGQSAPTDAITDEDPLNENPESESSSSSESEDSEKDLKAQAANVNDPKVSEQWMLEAIHAYEAWDKVKSEGRVTVAVIDSGCRTTHEDLSDNLVFSYDATGESGVEDILSNGHGTHVAGVLSAQANNGKGIAGVSYNAGFINIQVFTSGEVASSTTIASAIDWVIANAATYNIRVVNLSVAIPMTEEQAAAYKDSAVVRKAKQAYDAGILTVVAAGNDASSKGGAYISFPCDVMDFGLGVIALQNGDQPSRAAYSNYYMANQTTKDLSAPGTGIYSTGKGSDKDYSSLSGTSFSAPCVAGVAALVLAAKPDLTAGQVADIIVNSAADLGDTGWDLETGAGMVDASAAIDGLGEYLDGPTSMLAGQQVTLVPSFSTGWVWSSSNPSVASVDGGVVTGNGGGSAVITASYGSTTLTRTITVYDVSFSGESTVQVDHPLQLAFNENPNTGMWVLDTEDPNIAVVSATSSGATVYGVSAGTTNVRAKLATNKDLVVTFPVTVVAPESFPMDLAEATWPEGFEYNTAAKPYVYTGDAITPLPTQVAYTSMAGETTQLTEGVDYTLSYSNNVNASSGTTGTGKVTLTGMGQYTGTKEYTFYIWPLDIADASITVGSIGRQYYTNKALTPVPAVSWNGTPLANGIDFTLAYKDNAKAGTATATITGTGNFGGTRTTTFKILGTPSLSGPATTYLACQTTYTVKNGSIVIKTRSGAADAKISKNTLVAGKKTGTVTLSLRDTEGNEFATKNVRIVKAAGYWTFASVLGGSYVLDVAGASLVNGGNIQLYKSNGSLAQKYQLTLKTDGTYVITSANTKKAIEVAGASKSNGANVQQYKSNGTNAQRWYLFMDASGKVSFKNKNSSKMLDVKGGKAKNAANVRQYKSNSTKAQKWTMKSVKADVGVVASGQYRISSTVNTGFVLDVAGASKNNAANVQLYKWNKSSAQKWNVQYLGKGYYKITNANSGKALTVAGGSKKNGANVRQDPWKSAASQKWKIVKASSGIYAFKNAASGKVLDLAGAQAVNGHNIQQYKSNGTKAQRWKMTQL